MAESLPKRSRGVSSDGLAAAQSMLWVPLGAEEKTLLRGLLLPRQGASTPQQPLPDAAGGGAQEDGDGTLLVPVPEMTHETKVQVAKLCHRAGETAKISVRNARRKGMDVIKKATMTEDEGNRAEKDVQKMSEAFVKKIEELVSAKEKSILK